MNPQEELNQLLERQEALHQELKERKKELLEAQRVRKDTLKRQIRRAQSRITTAQRKRRTRQPDPHGELPGARHRRRSRQAGSPHERSRCVFLERDRDRELFNLAPNKENADGNPD